MTHKHAIKFSTGKLKEHFELAGRFSKINSDGYIDRASSDLKSYFLQGAYSNNNTLIKGLVFGGTEKTYLTYKGISAEQLQKDRRYNPAGNILLVDKHFSMITRLITTNKITPNFIGLKSGMSIGIPIFLSTIPKEKDTGNRWTIGGTVRETS